MKSNGLKTLAVALAALSFFSFGGCVFLEEESYAENVYDYSGPDASYSDPTFTPALPDGNKTVEREEVDGMGHKIVYYTDGTREDLGRVEPLDFSSPLPKTQYNYQSLAKEAKGEGLCAFYTDIYEACNRFDSSTWNLRKSYDSEGSAYYAIADVNYAKHGLTSEEATAVWKVFVDENPAFYWMDITFYYTKEQITLLCESSYATYAARATATENIRKMAYECDSYLDGTTTVTERALTIYDYLIAKIDYAYERDGVTPEEDSWAYTVAGGATYGLGVCECYAETYAYFCRMVGIPCLNVVGVAGEAGDSKNFGGHAWNYLNLEGKWYAVDITWADQEYLLRDYFGQEISDYHATHILDLPTAEWGISYQCEMPTLSGSLCPVLFGLEGGEKEMVGSIDEALAKMTDGQGRYEVNVYPDTKVTAQNDIDVYPQGATIRTTKTLPKVGYITFRYDGGLTMAKLQTENTVKLQSDISIVGLLFERLKWNTAFTYTIKTK